MRRAAALLAALALLLLPGCGQSGAGWEGPGECYAAEVPELPGEFEPELYCYYGGEGYRLAIASGGGLSVLSPGKLLFRLSGSGGGRLRVDENGAWLYCLDGEGVYLRLYSMEGELLAEAVLPAEPQGLLLARGRAWADLGERAVSLSPDGRTEELELPEGTAGCPASLYRERAFSSCHSMAAARASQSRAGFSAQGTRRRFCTLPGRRECTLWTPPGPGRRSWTLTPAASSRAG